MLNAPAAYASMLLLLGAPGAPVAPPADPPRGPAIRLEDLPPSQRLGIRADNVRRRISVISTVVLVPDAASYVAAISRWTPAARFPVLLDDGRWENQEAVARFVRAFKPRNVVRWRATTADGKPAPFPEETGAKRTLIEGAVAAAWGTPEGTTLGAHWRTLNFTPPGIVAMTMSDPAWTAGLALAAGRGQPIAWTFMDGEPSQWCELARVDALSEAIAANAAASGYTWDRLGDELDAVTLALNCPVKILLDERDERKMLAVTDVVGRHARGSRTERWAWASQVFGDSSRASIDAMSSLFLATPTMWLFDTYSSSQPWDEYDATRAAEPLAKLGLTGPVDDEPANRLRDWRARISGAKTMTAESRPVGINAGLIAVNTKGEGTFFEFEGGIGRAGDVPLLHRPSAVYFVHSWSFTAPTQPETIASRWLAHGAYQYCGSVHEPFLQGFVPTPAFTARLSAGVPWGAAVRFDDGEPWKIASFGDPLWTLLGEGARIEAPLPLEGTEDLARTLKGLAESGDFAELLRTLRLLARDSESVRFSRALLRDRPDAVTDDVALAGVMSAAFAGDVKTAAELADRCRNYQVKVPLLRALTWHLLTPVLGTLNERELDLMMASVRDDQLAQDGAELVPAVERVKGREGVRSFLEGLIDRAKDDATRQELRRLMR